MFVRCFADFGINLGPKINQQLIKNQSTNHPNDTTTKKTKILNITNVYGIIVPRAMLCYVRKSIKMVATSIKKQLTNQCSNFLWILEPTWLYFGRGLGVKMGPRWHQIAPKINPKTDQKMITLWVISRSIPEPCGLLPSTLVYLLPAMRNSELVRFVL